MKTSARIVIVLTVLSMGAAARAQTCTSTIAGWQGQYSLSGSGTATGGGLNWTVNESVSATVNASGGALSCTKAEWDSAYAVTTVSVNDSGVGPCPPGSAVGQATATITGSTAALAPPTSVISVDLSAGTYSFLPEPDATVTFAGVGCDGNPFSMSIFYIIEPSNWINSPATPPTF